MEQRGDASALNNDTSVNKKCSHVVHKPIKIEKSADPSALGSFPLMATWIHARTPTKLAGINLCHGRDGGGSAKTQEAPTPVESLIFTLGADFSCKDVWHVCASTSVVRVWA